MQDSDGALHRQALQQRLFERDELADIIRVSDQIVSLLQQSARATKTRIELSRERITMCRELLAANSRPDHSPVS